MSNEVDQPQTMVDPPGCYRVRGSSGRWIVAAIDIPNGHSLESFVLSHLWPWIDKLSISFPGLQASYDVQAHPPDKTTGEKAWRSDWYTCALLMLPPSSADRGPEMADAVGAALRNWNRDGNIGIYSYGLMNIDDPKEQRFFGNAPGLQICEQVESLCSEAVLDLVRTVGSVDAIPQRSVRVIELCYRVLKMSCRTLSSRQVSELIEKRCRDFAAQCTQEGYPIELESIRESLPAYVSALGEQIQAASRNREGDWPAILSRLEAQLAPMATLVESEWSTITSFIPAHDWVGRRLIHPLFSRFHLDASRECALLMALSSMFEKGTISWENPC